MSSSSSSSSAASSSDEIEELSKAGSPQCHPAPLRVSTHLAPEDASSFLFYHDDDGDDSDERDGLRVGRWGVPERELEPEREREDDEATLNEQGPGPDVLVVEEEDPSPIDPFFKPKSQPHSLTASPQPLPSPPLSSEQEQARELERAPSADSSQYVHSRGSSFDCTSPWFMHVSAGALAALDDQLLQSPVDAFADLCYARAVQLPADAAPVPYSWRRFSRLRPLSPFSDIHEADEADEGESSSGSDDEDEVVSPSDALDWMAQGARPRIYSPTPHAHRDAHPPAHPRHYAQESDGSIQFRSQVSSRSCSCLCSCSRSLFGPSCAPPLPPLLHPSLVPGPGSASLRVRVRIAIFLQSSRTLTRPHARACIVSCRTYLAFEWRIGCVSAVRCGQRHLPLLPRPLSLARCGRHYLLHS